MKTRILTGLIGGALLFIVLLLFAAYLFDDCLVRCLRSGYV